MRDEEEGDPGIALYLLELELHLFAQLLVQRAQRLVEKQNFRPQDQRASQRDALPLAAGQLRGAPLGEMAQLNLLKRFADHLLAQVGVDLAHPQPVRDVLGDRAMRKQRVVLENGVHLTVERRGVGDVGPIQQDRSRRHILEAGDHPQNRGLAGSGRAEHRKELALPDVDAEVVHGGEVTEPLADSAYRDGSGSRRVS